MEVSYKKDLHNNYLVLAQCGESNEETYGVHMLNANTIEGIIKPEQRIIDNQVLYYYDITSKQSMDTIYIKNIINYEQLRRYFIKLADLVEQSYEYLLNENDLVLEPELTYIELATGQINVCYLPGYNIDIKKQFATFIEYVMNKLEYKDKEAVLYVYNLYALCRDEGFSFINLLMAIRDQKINNSNTIESRKDLSVDIKKVHKSMDSHTINKQETSPKEHSPSPKEKTPRSQIPVMMEKISDDSEQYYYPLRTYIYTGAYSIGAIFIFLIFINSKILLTSLGNRIDYGKLMALLLILLIIIAYGMKIIWDKKNRLTRIISKQEYVDPRVDYELKLQAGETKAEQRKDVEEYTLLKSKADLTRRPDDRPNATVLLNSKIPTTGSYLEPENKDKYDVIQISDYPFVIGKLRSNVDYCLDNEMVSRYHVKITKEGDIYYITDLNSTNGTSLNEKPLPCYQRYELTNGDVISMAGIKYSFRIYE